MLLGSKVHAALRAVLRVHHCVALKMRLIIPGNALLVELRIISDNDLLVVHELLVPQIYIKEEPLTALAIKLEVPDVNMLYVLIVPIIEPMLVAHKNQRDVVSLMISVIVAVVVVDRIAPLVLLGIHGTNVPFVPLMILAVVALHRAHLMSALASLMLEVLLEIPGMITAHSF